MFIRIKKYLLYVTVLFLTVVISVLTTQYVSKTYPKERIKEASFLGDSITEGFGTTKAYPKFIGDKTGWKINNYGIQATTISNIKPQDSFVSRISSISETSDYIVVFGGTNDYNFNAPMGTIDSTDNSSFYGALNNIITWVLTNRPNAKLILVTPLKRYPNHDGKFVDGDSPNNLGFTIKDYVDAIIKTGEKYSTPIVDLYRNSGIDPKIEIQKTTYMPDGVHPNINGHERIYPLILRKMI